VDKNTQYNGNLGVFAKSFCVDENVPPRDDEPDPFDIFSRAGVQESDGAS
jgi:hypothetical protein